MICRSINDNYLRKVPTFIRTYKMYSFKSTAWKEMKGLKPHLFEGARYNTIHNLIRKFSV